MSNLDLSPSEVTGGRRRDAADGPVVLQCRNVPLGGPRAMPVRRSLPQRAQSLIGAWCFVDHYGPDDVSRTRGMIVPGHPHGGIGGQAACRQASAFVPVATYPTSRNTRVCPGMVRKLFRSYTYQMFSCEQMFS